MTWLFSTDLHLTDRPRDAYRFGLFKWLSKQQERHKVTATFLLGDITDSKDRHSSALVNRIIDELIQLKRPVYILRGNHDGLSPQSPFFRFLSCIEGIKFIVRPTFDGDLGVAFVPHCVDQPTFDAACGGIPSKINALLLHNTFDGAIAESGSRLTGLSASPIEVLKPARVYAGDVHKPQQCGPVTYVGAPFHVRHGDQFEPRVLLLKGEHEQDLHFECPRKLILTVRDPDEIAGKAKRGDQVKVIVELAREEAVEWHEHKSRVLAACKEGGLEVFGIEMKITSGKRRERIELEAAHAKTPSEIMKAFCATEGVASNVKQAGLELI
jgi:Calcineurin-like phosphoesterase